MTFGRIAQFIGLAGVIAVVSLGAYMASLVWTSPDYAATGTCTTADIAKTYAILDTGHGFPDATQTRVLTEYWTLRPHELTIRGDIERAWAAAIYNRFGRRETAAFICNHGDAGMDVSGGRTVPQLAVLLQSEATDEDARWKLATCMAVRRFRVGAGTMTPDRIKSACEAWYSWAARR